MAIGNLILVHFDRQLTEAEFYDVMSDVLEREGTNKFFKTGIHSVVAQKILNPEIWDDTIELCVYSNNIIRWEGYCALSWYKGNGYENEPVYTIDEFIDIFRPDLLESMNFEDELMALIGG